MNQPLLHIQLEKQLCQWIKPKDKRHLLGFAEIIASILCSQSACLSKWIPYLGHRNCQARAHMERLSYFLNNKQITPETFYHPLLKHFLQEFAGSGITLVLDTSVLWDRFCLIEITLAWGGRSLTIAQQVIEHNSATVGFEDYLPVLEQAKGVIPDNCSVIFLADRGFEHRKLLSWLKQAQWSWYIRAKSDLHITRSDGREQVVADLFPPLGQAYLIPQLKIFGQIDCHLAIANSINAAEPWAVLSDRPNSLQTFAHYGGRFGAIEPHFKDYKSAAFRVLESHLRCPVALSRLFMLLDVAYLIGVLLGMMLIQQGRRKEIDWHHDRGLSFLQLGLRELARLCYQGLALPSLAILPRANPPPAFASRKRKEEILYSIEFSKVISLS